MSSLLPKKLIEPKSVTNEVISYLRNELLVGTSFPPGAYIREAEVSELLNVSRAPIREALKELEADGIVKTIPRRGAYVLGFTQEEVNEIYDIRLTLEMKIFKRIIKNKLLTAPHYNWLKSCINRFYALSTKFNDNLAAGQLEFYNIDCEFHFYIHELSGMTWTANILKHVYTRLYQIIIRNIASEDIEMLVNAHESLLENLRLGNVKGLRKNRSENYVLNKN